MQRFGGLKLIAWVACVATLSACGGGGGGSSNNNPPPATTYTVSGTVTGLTSSSFVVRLNGANDVTVSASGAFNFTTQLTTGTTYTVTIGSQPAAQICGPNVVNGTGAIGSANVTNVSITCAAYSVGGTVTGLTGTGLVLQLNYANNLPVAAPAGGNGPFAFPTPASTPVLYTLHVKTQPTGQTCTIVSSSGVLLATAPNITSPTVACIDNVTDPLSGTYELTTLNGQAVTALRSYLSFSADGTYLFGLHQDDSTCGSTGHGGLEYGVYRFNKTTHAFEIRNSVIDTNGDCGIAGASGFLVGNADGTLTYVGIDTTTWTPVTSATGSLTGSWGDNQGFIVYDGNGKLFSALTRAIVQNPATNPGVEDGCYTLTGAVGSGTLTYDFACAVSASQTGVDTSGPVGANPAYVGVTLNFTVTGDTLSITPGFPFMANTRIVTTPVPVSTFTVGGTISGLTSTGLNLRLNGKTDADYNLSPAAGATSFQFPAQLQAGTKYSVGPIAQPATPTTQFCGAPNGAGTIVASNVATVTVNCGNTTSYTLGGQVSGLSGSGLALRVTYVDATGAVLSAPDLGVAVNATSYLFPVNTVPANSAYFLGIATQPNGETCTVIRGTSFSFGPNTVTNVSNIVCTANAASTLRGTYSVMNDTGTGRNYLNFNGDGTLTTALVHNDPDCGSTNGNGVEYGVFSWNSTTGDLQLQNPPAIDTNGGCGLWEPGAGPANTSFNLLHAGTDTLQLRETAGGPLLGSALAVTSNAGTLVGGWAREAGNGNFFVFHADGTFMTLDVQASNVYPAGYGQERGCYTVSGSTLTLTAEGTCRPDGLAPQDFNGEAGLFRAAVKTVSGVTFTLTGDTLAIFGGVYKRTAPN